MDFSKIPSPSFVLDEARFRGNLELIARVQREAGVQVILAFKGFAMWSAFPIVRKHVHGATASSLNEARLCFEEMKAKAHTYSVAYLLREFGKILRYSSHITFNSMFMAMHRDEAMLRYHAEFPQYHWDQNKGYPTAAHRRAIQEHGPSPLHRKSFRVTLNVEGKAGQ